MHSQRAERKIQFVLNHDQVRFRTQLVLLDQLANRNATQVHERLRFRQQHLFVPDDRSRRQCPALSIPDFHLVIVSQPIDYKKAQIMRRDHVLRPRIAKPNDQLHAVSLSSTGRVGTGALARPVDRSSTAHSTRVHYFFSFFSAFSGAAASPPSSSASCLPFFMTSGSAGAAAAPAIASAAGASSSLMLMTWATGWSASVKNFSLSLFGRSATRRTILKTSSLTSSSIWFGMSPGRHSTSTSRVICSRIPPCCFTPAGSPISSIGTLTLSFWSMAIRFTSM